MSALVAGFFALWAIASLAALVPRFTSWLRDHDLVGLLPQWKFFAPIPGRGDFYLLYRDIYAEDMTGWTELPLGGERRWWNFLWNPRRRERKAVFDAARELPLYLTPEEKDAVHVSVPYLLMLSYVSAQPRTLPPLRTQFLLMYGEAGGAPEVSMLSYMHGHSR